MKVRATKVCFDGQRRHRPGSVFEWPLDRMPVISRNYTEPVDESDRELYDYLSTPLHQRPKVRPSPKPKNDSGE